MAVDWADAVPVEIDLSELTADPDPEGSFGPVPAVAAKVGSYARWSRDLARWLVGSQTVDLFRSPSLAIFSAPGETEADFRARLQQGARERRDGAVEALRKKYGARIATLEDRLRRFEQAIERETDQSRESKVQTARWGRP